MGQTENQPTSKKLTVAEFNLSQFLLLCFPVLVSLEAEKEEAPGLLYSLQRSYVTWVHKRLELPGTAAQNSHRHHSGIYQQIVMDVYWSSKS